MMVIATIGTMAILTTMIPIDIILSGVISISGPELSNEKVRLTPLQQYTVSVSSASILLTTVNRSSKY